MGKALIAELTERIRSTGPVPFATFMERALYHPTDGYYVSRVPGNGVHYATSASLTPWFGTLVARDLARMWAALGRPDPFTVVEMGAGFAGIAAAAMQAPGDLAAVLRWRFVEQFDGVRANQRQRLGAAAQRAEWSPALEGPPAVGCVLVNEVLDNFPVHVLEVGRDAVHEVYVDLDGAGLAERLGPLSTPALEEPARAAREVLAAGDRFEVCPGLEDWCREAYATLDRGFLLVVDYGDLEPGVWAHGPTGTIATYGPKELGRSPLGDPGSKDITADVNFSALVRAARAAGWAPEVLTHQRDWLHTLGLPALARCLTDDAAHSMSWGRLEEAEGILGQRDLVHKLADEEGLGACLVFRASKGVRP
ncbi:MAG: SAM-dependent methyltransferase [Actinomycetota bacterium]